jgi:hypothetical protein
MQIFLKVMDNTLTVDVDPSMSIESLKAMVENQEFIPVDQQALVCNAEELTGSLSSCGVARGCTVECVLAVAGGAHKNNPWKKATAAMRWKWRKKRTRRLMKKRRKMRLRAR